MIVDSNKKNLIILSPATKSYFKFLTLTKKSNKNFVTLIKKVQEQNVFLFTFHIRVENFNNLEAVINKFL